MNSISFIRQSLDSTLGLTLSLVTDLQDAPLTQPTEAGGNHTLWILTHLAYSESSLFDCFILGKPNRYEEWSGAVGIDSVPSTAASDYPTMNEAQQMLQSIRADVLAYLDTIDENTLDATSHAPEDFADGFGTIGKCFTAMIMHVSLHAGQLTVIRRSLGRSPLMA